MQASTRALRTIASAAGPGAQCKANSSFNNMPLGSSAGHPIAADVHALRSVKCVPNCVQVIRTQDVVICK